VSMDATSLISSRRLLTWSLMQDLEITNSSISLLIIEISLLAMRMNSIPRKRLSSQSLRLAFHIMITSFRDLAKVRPLPFRMLVMGLLSEPTLICT